jgi:hypothetical protein
MVPGSARARRQEGASRRGQHLRGYDAQMSAERTGRGRAWLAVCSSIVDRSSECLASERWGMSCIFRNLRFRIGFWGGLVLLLRLRRSLSSFAFFAEAQGFQRRTTTVERLVEKVRRVAAGWERRDPSPLRQAQGQDDGKNAELRMMCAG